MTQEQEVKYRFDGSLKLQDGQMPHEIFTRVKVDETKKNTDHSCKVETCEVSGDGSVGIEGNITIKGRQQAITFICGLMEQFDISKDEVDL